MKTWNPVSVDDALAYLNDLTRRDPKAMHALVETRHPCNQALADHPTAQVHTENGTEYSIGLLGVLNGLFGVDDDRYGPITAHFEGDAQGLLISFSKTAPQAFLKKTK